MLRGHGAGAVVALLTVGVSILPASALAATTTERASVSSAGTEGNGPSARFGGDTAVTANGRFVAFGSEASNLVAGDVNGAKDIFVRDRLSGSTERVSVSTSGQEANVGSGGPSLSADGRYVAFSSAASNLVAGDTNARNDTFVRDRQSGTTERVSLSSAGAEGDNLSGAPAISSDGRFVAFWSYASNLVAGDTNGQSDVFLRDRQSGTTERISVSTAGAQGDGLSQVPTISGDG